MAKKVNEVQDGDLKSNIVVLRSVLAKLVKNIIFNHKDSRGRIMQNVWKELIPKEILFNFWGNWREAKGLAAYIPETELFVIEDGKTFNLDDVYENNCLESQLKTAT